MARSRLRVEGVVVDVYPGDNFLVRLDNDARVLAYLSGKVRRARVRIILGDRVVVELSEYELTRGRLVWRLT